MLAKGRLHRSLDVFASAAESIGQPASGVIQYRSLVSDGKRGLEGAFRASDTIPIRRCAIVIPHLVEDHTCRAGPISLDQPLRGRLVSKHELRRLDHRVRTSHCRLWKVQADLIHSRG